MEFLETARDIDLFEKNPATGEEITYLSRIEDLQEDALVISQPFVRDSYWRVLQAEPGRVFDARATVDKGWYFFEIELVKIDEENGNVWVMSRPFNVRRTQRREHVRFNVLIDITMDVGDEFIKKRVPAYTKNISAGGVQVVTEMVPSYEDDVKISIPLSKDLKIECGGKILRIIPPETSLQRCITAMKFKDLPPEKQEAITKYIFQQEVERRKKERSMFGKSLR